MPPDSRHAGPADSPVPDAAISQLIERIRSAAQQGTPLCIRGGGTKDFYGGPRIGVPLDTRPLAGVRSYEPSELFVTVGAGTPLAQLESLLAEQGQCLPFEPPRFASGGTSAGTVGGMVAAGLSGPTRASVGAVRDYVLGATIINGRGQLLTFGGQVMKNVAGYDVSRVLAGSLGILGVIAEVSLKVLPLAPAQATLVFECSQADALRLLNGWGGQPLPLNASRWQADADGTGRLWLRLRGAVAAVDAACKHLGGERQDDGAAEAEWTACRDHTTPFFTQGGDLWRLAVPQTAPVLALAASPLVEWHGGQRWYVLPPGQAERVRAAAHAVGGHATLFRLSGGTIDPAARAAPFDPPSAPHVRIHAALKREFDPQGVFNRARLHPDF